MKAKFTLAAWALIVVIPAAGQAKKIHGEIPNRRALADVQTYCIDKSRLSGSDRYLLDSFLKTESKPKHLLTKLPWKLVERCGDAAVL